MRSRDDAQRTVNTIQVENVDATCNAVTQAGGQVCVPKMAIQGVGWLAYCLDPTGVLFGVMHMDESAR
jgi:predicted enzyme related to lactoylglutathione lyase